MTRSGVVWVAVAMTMVLAEPSASAQSPAAADSADRAETTFRRANELAKANKWPEALELYREAIALRKAWDIAGNLGIAKLEVGNPAAAAMHLHYALAHIGATAKPEHKELFKRSFERARSQVGAVTVRSTRAGAQVLVDGVVAGTAPLAAPLFVLAGRHRIEAIGPGSERGETSVEATAGGSHEVSIEIAAPSPTVPPSTPDGEDDGRPWWPAALLGGGGGGASIGVGVGIGLLVVSGGASGRERRREGAGGGRGLHRR